MSITPSGPRPAPRAPLARALTAAAGLAALLLGGSLATRPFTSLALLLLLVFAGLVVAAIAEALDLPAEPAQRRLAIARAALYALAALALAAWTGAGVRAVILVVGLTLLVGGVLEVWGARTTRGVERWNAVLGGAASAIFGLLALSWPDVSVIVIGVLFGVRLVLLGARLLWASVRPAPASADAPSPVRRALRLVGNGLAVALAVVLVLVGAALERGAPEPDAFYDTPDTVPATPGELLRSEPFDRAIPEGAQAWRILYTTTRDDGQAAVASALVVVPEERAARIPVIAWAHGTTGAARGCAPTLLDPFESGAFFNIDKVVDAGWGFVATDYVGLGTEGPHPYLIGQAEGRSVLDATRAAQQLTEAGLGRRTVVWGHSQGGHAALWTGVLAEQYAPELDIAGVAALAPASNLPALIDNLGNVTGGELFASYVIDSYARVYDDVSYGEYVRPGAQPIVKELARRCLAEPSTLVSVATVLSLDKPIWRGDPNRGTLADRLAENVPTGPISAPLLIGQGADDQLVVPAAQEAYVASRCAAGQQLDYRVYEGRDHVPLVERGSPAIPELLAWTEDRFAGKPAKDTCP